MKKLLVSATILALGTGLSGTALSQSVNAFSTGFDGPVPAFVEGDSGSQQYFVDVFWFPVAGAAFYQVGFVDNTAHLGEDYFTPPLDFSNFTSDTKLTVRVAIIGDLVPEPVESFLLNVTAFTSEGAVINSANVGYVAIFIFDNDLPPVSAVPEPESYAMLLAGLGLLGFAARRRKLKDAATA